MLAAEQLSICGIGRAWHRWWVDYTQMRFDLEANRIANFLGLPADQLSVEEMEKLVAIRPKLLAGRRREINES